MLTIILTGVLAVAIAALAMGIFGSRSQFEVNGRTIIVTGGSQGLGLSVSKQLAAKGANVIIIAQTVSKLERAMKEVEASAINTNQRFMYMSFDLRSPESAPLIIEQATKWNDGPPDVVFNCAGNCVPGFFASSSIETHKTQMDTVYWTCAYMAHAALNSWTKPTKFSSTQPRHLIFTSSVVAFFPLAGYASYSPAKAAMRALADTLNQEVAVYNGARLHTTEAGPGSEIKVHIAFPMGILSPGYENEQKTKPKVTQMLEEDDTPQLPDLVARNIISGLEAGQFMLTSSFIPNIMRGWGMGGSQRTSLLDYFWGWLGSLIALFIVPEYMAKCRKWGKENGLSAAR